MGIILESLDSKPDSILVPAETKNAILIWILAVTTEELRTHLVGLIKLAKQPQTELDFLDCQQIELTEQIQTEFGLKH